ncbi:hypothetical protein ABIB48_002662 [Arthrobacter sp. UYCu511]
MSAPEIRIEAVRSRTRPGSVRHWITGPDADEVLHAATCRTCGVLTPAKELAADRNSPGGRRLQCPACKAVEHAAHIRTPTGAATVKARDRRRVESDRNAERQRHSPAPRRPHTGASSLRRHEGDRPTRRLAPLRPPRRISALREDPPEH